MSLRPAPAAPPPTQWGATTFLVLVLAVTAIRLLGLWLSVVELNLEEAQYWEWSRHFAFGYFSKPPLIAWIIAATTGVCGDGEACVRASAPLFYAGTSLAVYGLAAALYGRSVAFLAGLTALFSIAIVFSSRIISTDVPLLLFWSLALFAYVRRLQGGGWPWLLLLALAFAGGLLAKYAMAYFVMGILLAGIMSAEGRRALRDRPMWLALILGLLALVPNLVWNADHGFSTFRHVGHNVSGDGLTFSLAKGLDFLVSQFVVAGPVIFGALLYLLIRPRSARLEDRDRMLVAFILPPLVLVALIAFVTRAYPNWAAPAYISAMALVPALLLRWERKWLVWLGIALGIVFQVILLIGDMRADRLHIAAFGGGNPYADTMGMRDRAARVEALAAAAGTTTVVPQSRRDFGGLIYYLRHSKIDVRAWPRDDAPPENYYEQAFPLARPFPDVLVTIADCPDTARYGSVFAKAELLEKLTYLDAPPGKKPDYAVRLSEPVAGGIRPGSCD